MPQGRRDINYYRHYYKDMYAEFENEPKKADSTKVPEPKLTAKDMQKAFARRSYDLYSRPV